MTHIVPAFLCVFFPMVPAFTDAAATQLAEDAGLALDRVGLSRQAAAITIDVPLNKLSDQLNGKAPFTYLWRLFVGLDAEFRQEFLDIIGSRVGATVVRNTDLQRLVRGIEALAGKRRMAKVSIASTDERRVG